MKRVLAVILLLALALVACGAGGDSSSVTNPTEGPEVVVYQSPT